MENDQQMEKVASGIADAIVALVERADGPVTLSRIEREVPGFAKKGPPTWSRVLERSDGEALIWDGMTEAGSIALGKVMAGRRVAVQMVSPILYMIEGDALPQNENWLPVVLLPATAAQPGNAELAHAYFIRLSRLRHCPSICRGKDWLSTAHTAAGAVHCRQVLTIKALTNRKEKRATTMSLLGKLKEAQAEIAARETDHPWKLRLERVRGKVDYDGLRARQHSNATRHS